MPFPESNIIQEPVNIHQYPNEAEQIASEGDLTIGDLHSNAIKLFYFLFKHKIIAFKEEFRSDSKKHYEDLVKIYLQLNLNDDTKKLLKKREKAIYDYLEKGGNLENYPIRTVKTDDIDLVAFEDNYIKSDPEEKKHFKKIFENFYTLLQKIKVLDKETFIRLIGDELADRGSNDLCILILYKFLRENGANVTTLISNHGIEFLKFYFESKSLGEKQFASIKDGIDDRQKPSLYALKHILELGVISKAEFEEDVEKNYLPTLKVLDYNLTDDGIQLFTHAPVRFDVIKYMVNKLNELKIDNEPEIQYRDDTAQQLAETIDAINLRFNKYLNAGRYADFFEIAQEDKKLGDIELGEYSVDYIFQNGEKEEKIEFIKKYPFYYVVWNRWSAVRDDEKKVRPARKKNYNIYYIHGHDSYKSEIKHVLTLDTPLGKFLEYFYDLYKVLNTKRNYFQNPVLAESKSRQYLKSTGIFSASLFVAGMFLGVALVLAGVTAPFGIGILGSLAFGLLLGGSIGIISGIGGAKLAHILYKDEQSKSQNSIVQEKPNQPLKPEELNQIDDSSDAVKHIGGLSLFQTSPDSTQSAKNLPDLAQEEKSDDQHKPRL